MIVIRDTVVRSTQISHHALQQIDVQVKYMDTIHDTRRSEICRYFTVKSADAPSTSTINITPTLLTATRDPRFMRAFSCSTPTANSGCEPREPELLFGREILRPTPHSKTRTRTRTRTRSSERGTERRRVQHCRS